MPGKGKKVGRCVKSPSHSRYNGESRHLINKARKKVKHEKLLAKQAIRLKIREELTFNVVTKTKNKVGFLRKEFGTLNIKRLTDILNNTYDSAEWYISRKKKSEVRNENTKDSLKKNRRAKKKAKRRSNERLSSR